MTPPEVSGGRSEAIVRTQASVVIVGAGIVGCAAAHFLTKLGWRDVVVVEQGPLFATGGSTSHAPGLVFQTSGAKTLTSFAREAVRTYAALELDGEPAFYQVGSLEVAATAERWADLQRKLGWARSWGVEACLLSPDEAKARLPLLDAGTIRGALFVPSDGIAKGVRAAEAMARAAGDGATFYGQTAVTGIDVAAGRVRAVVTSAGRIVTERVLICAGIWGPGVGRMAGVTIPLAPVEHQLAWTTPLPSLAGETREIVQSILRHQDRDLYFRQRGDRYAVGSYAHEPVVVDPDAIRRYGETEAMPASNPFAPDVFAPAWADAVALLPELGQTQIIDAFNGMFSFTPDGFPLLGEAAAVRGCWVAEAIWITHGAGAAKAVAEWMTDGTPTIDLHECDVNRFEPHAVAPGYVRARGAQQYREIYDVIHPLQPMTEPRPRRTSPVYGRLRDLGGVFFEARGWEQPRWFAANERLLDEYRVPTRDGWAGQFWSPIAAAEQCATRERAALFDLTPLPKLEVSGPGALSFLQRLTTNQLDRPAGSVTYTLLLDELGGVRSDVTVARLGAEHFQLGCNGVLDLHWLRRHLPEDGSVHVRDVTGALCCLGLWGPAAREIVTSVSLDEFGNDAFPYFGARQVAIGEVPVLALRVSYVGELGWELYAPTEYGARLWDLLWKAGQDHGLITAGRAAFEALRLEKGYRLWGADVQTEHNPYEAGLGFAVRLNKGEFFGREALRRITDAGIERRLCCLTLDDPSVVVMGKEPIWVDGRVAGYVTSAAYGAAVARSIAYGYLPPVSASVGSKVAIEYFGDRHPATVMREPLFDPEGTRLRA